MELNYRGSKYQSNPIALELTEGEISGKYRGANLTQHYLRHIPVPQPVAELKYRGVSYCTGDPVDIEAASIRKNYSQETKPTVSSRSKVLKHLDHIHLTNIRRNLEHRMQVAKASGDRHLLQLLEAELQQIAG